jgi:rhodanese-related sulfurtransferase
MHTMTPEDLRRRWRDNREVALLDAREEGPFADSHPFFAVPLPRSRIETSVYALVPRRNAPVVVYDDGEGLAERAAARLEGLGYTDVSLLEGGLRGYARVGELFRDVNVPSKAFGELVEAICHTPSLTAAELKARIDGGADMVVLDARRFEEYQTMSIPGATSVPGAELTLRAFDLAPSPDTLVVVNCAGRTRSIIGTQTLVNAGLPNPVAALRNGTIGWTLNGFALAHGQARRAGPASGESHARARSAAGAWAARAGVPVIDGNTLDRWIGEKDTRTLYCFDVRAPHEYQAGHARGFLSAPGGQLVQAIDEWVAVRGARLVLSDDDGVRARMTASWLVQMGWDASVVEPGALALDEQGMPPRASPPLPDVEARSITAGQLRAAEATVVDLAPSPAYRQGHIPGARFGLRSQLDEVCATLPGAGPIVLTSADGALAAYALDEAAAVTTRAVRILAGGTAAWSDAGFPLEREPQQWASPPIDVYKRPYEGTDNARAAMQAYIDWELGLVAQLANDGVSNFRVVR